MTRKYRGYGIRRKAEDQYVIYRQGIAVAEAASWEAACRVVDAMLGD